MAGHPLRSATDRRLGGPLHRQQANQTRAHPIPVNPFTPAPCGAVVIFGISNRFQLLSQCIGQVAHALLTSPPLRTQGQAPLFSVRLACVKHAASVRPEPESNS